MDASPHPSGPPQAAAPSPARSPSGFALRERLLPWGLALLLVAPSIAWVSMDRAVWSWDPASYATESVDLWFKLTHEPGRWLHRMRTVFPAKAPGAEWLGQVFVPLGRAVGSVEAGLLASVLLVQLATLVLMFRIGRKVAPRSIVPAVVGMLFVGASPMFVAMSHHFLTEPLQLFSIAYLVWVAVEASAGPPVRMLLHLALAVTVGLVAKFATPAFVVFPGALAAVRVVRGFLRPRGRLVFGVREGVLAAVLVAVFAMGLSWYLRNARHVYEFAKLASSSEIALDYGRKAPVAVKLEFWLGAMGWTLVQRWTSWLAVGFLPFAAWAAVRRVRWADTSGAGHGALVLAGLAQLALVLYVLARSINEETRYLLALAPTLALAVVWVADAWRARWIPVAMAAVLAAQWAVVHAGQLGLVAANAASYWEKAPTRDAARMRALSEVEGEVCRREDAGRPIMTGVDLDWLNYCSLTFYSSKAQLERGFRCGYEYLGHAQKDPEAGFRKIVELQSPYFVSVEEAAMPQPPDFLNKAALEVLERVRADASFEPVRVDPASHIVVFRHVGPWQPGR